MYHIILRLIKPTELKIPKAARTAGWISCIVMIATVVIGLIVMTIEISHFSFPAFITLISMLMLSVKFLIDCSMTDEDFIEETKSFVMYHIGKSRSTLFDVEDKACEGMKAVMTSDTLTIDSIDLLRLNDPSLQVKNATQIIITLSKDGTKISSKSIIWYHPKPSLVFENNTGLEDDLLHFKLGKIETIDVSSEYSWYGVELYRPEKLVRLHYKAVSSNSAVTMSELRKRIGTL